MANTRIFNTLNDENLKRIGDLKFSEEKFNEKLRYYLMIVDYEEEKKRYTDKRELAGLKTELAKYAKLEEVKKDSANLKEQFQKLSTKISESLATKQDLLRVEVQQKKFSVDTFTTIEDSNSQFKALNKAVAGIEKLNKLLTNQFDEIKTLSKALTEEVALKCDIREINKINEQLTRFALYDDYKDLYNRVVPPTVQVEINIRELSDQIAQF